MRRAEGMGGEEDIGGKRTESGEEAILRQAYRRKPRGKLRGTYECASVLKKLYLRISFFLDKQANRFLFCFFLYSINPFASVFFSLFLSLSI